MIAYQERNDDRDGGQSSVFTIHPDGTGKTAVGPLFLTGYPTWSPDGSTLAIQVSSRFTYRSGVWAYGSPDSAPTLITRDSGQPVWRPNFSVPATASPAETVTGPALAFTAASSRGYDVFTAHPDGTAVRQLTFDGLAAGGPAWSPDHSTLAYVTSRAFSSRYRLWDVDPRTGARTLLATTRREMTSPAWAPGGHKIAWVANEARIIMLNLRTGVRTEMPPRNLWTW